MRNETPDVSSAQATEPAHDGPVTRFIRNSPRLCYLVDRVLSDGTLSANPLAWIPFLWSGPRPPTQRGLAKAIRSWARRRFRVSGCIVTVTTVDAPPPLLDVGGGGIRHGVALVAAHPGGAQMQAWFASDGSRGSWCSFRDGAADIATGALEPLGDEGDALAQLDKLSRRFIDEGLMQPAFEAWLERHAPAWARVDPDIDEAVAENLRGEVWCFVEFVHGDHGNIVLGMSALSIIGSCEFGVFFCGADGRLSRQHHVGYAGSPDALGKLLSESFAAGSLRIPTWVLHRVVPPIEVKK